MTSPRSISIIIPSYNDPRIGGTIDSVRFFDDLDCCRILVIDGGSRPEVLDVIRSRLNSDDVLISEPDEGIFDALNKGLRISDTSYIGWLGSDDFFSGEVLASEVVNGLRTNDVVVASTGYFTGSSVSRVTYGWPCRAGLVKYGLNHPHFSTFGRAPLFKSEQFRLDLRGSDIDYFIKIFAKANSILSINRIATFARQGGYSTKSITTVLRTNAELLKVYAQHAGVLWALAAVVIKLAYKVISKIHRTIFKIPVSSRFRT